MTERTAADGASRNGYQASHQWLLGVLRDAVREAVDAGPAGQDREGSLGWRIGAALGSLLAAHPVDRRGRCRLCRGRGWWSRRRVCMVFSEDALLAAPVQWPTTGPPGWRVGVGP